jgi:prolyl-tRNA synthetase
MENAIEVGHVFKLGTKYSDALNAKYLDENGSLKTIIMGCYGIGVSRIIAGLAETSHDDFGIIWPVSLAPYEICVCPVKASDPVAMEAAEKITAGLQAAGCDVILDDRDERPGVKFKDADLIGFPVRVTIGKGLTDGNVEIKWRWDSESTLVSVDDVVDLLAAQVKEERVSGERFTAAKNK